MNTQGENELTLSAIKGKYYSGGKLSEIEEGIFYSEWMTEYNFKDSDSLIEKLDDEFGGDYAKQLMGGAFMLTLIRMETFNYKSSIIPLALVAALAFFSEYFIQVNEMYGFIISIFALISWGIFLPFVILKVSNKKIDCLNKRLKFYLIIKEAFNKKGYNKRSYNFPEFATCDFVDSN